MKHLGLTAAVVAAATALTFAPALAQRPFDPRTYQDRVVGEPTQILVLATPHLSGAPDSFDPAVLEPLLDRLAAFRPDVITIEALSGESVQALWQYRDIYPEAATTYGWRTMTIAAMARQATQLDMPDAEAEARRLLAEWPPTPTPAQRRRLAAVFLAAGDPHSALVQWWRLDPTERRAEDGVTAQLAEQLAGYETRRNENHLIAVRLAVRLGLERVYPVDDHADDDSGETFQQNFQAFSETGWIEEIMSDERFRPLREAAQTLTTPDQTLSTYRMLNTRSAGQLDANMQWLSMLTRESQGHVGRARVALWETRNMRQAAHIREVTAQFSGRRVLVIVGSAHKPWFDAYLGMMTDVEIVDASRALR